MGDLKFMQSLNLELPSEKSLERYGHLLEVVSGRNQHRVPVNGHRVDGHQAVAVGDESDENGSATSDVKVSEVRIERGDDQTKE